MPELPEVQALVNVIAERLADARLAALDVTAFSALKTASPPYTDLLGRRLAGTARRGKFCVLEFEGPLYLVVHLARAGWLRLTDRVPSTPARPGRGPLVMRAVFVTDDGEPLGCLEVTEAGTRKGAAIYVVADLADVPGIAALGTDALELAADPAGLAAALAAAGGTRIKNAIRDQRLIAGIGNAYSDEILHAARLSPYATAEGLGDDQVAALAIAITDILTDATARAEATDPTAMKAEKKTGLRIHDNTGAPCPVCGTTIAEVALADRAFQYCPTCQTKGQLLADRRMSRLLK